MRAPPTNPKIYHITHVDNLAKIARDGLLWSDAKRIEMGLECHLVGMSRIKERRLSELSVTCHPATKVGDYVPFYLCPRSIMLYILHKGNHPDVTYCAGQDQIVHLVADLRVTAAWAEEQRRLWAFSDCNAGARYANFYTDLVDLRRIDWAAVVATDFRDLQVKEGKQAEFLVHESFPWSLIEEIGVRNVSTRNRVQDALADVGHQPPVTIQAAWYY